MGTDADQPSGFAKRILRPPQFDIDDVASIGVDWPDGFNFLPLDMSRHQSAIKNSALINREHDHIGGGTLAETVHEKGNAD